MAREDGFDLEAMLVKEVSVAREMRAASWVHFPSRDVGRVALMTDLGLPYRLHFQGRQRFFCYGPESCSHCHHGMGWKSKVAWPVWDLIRGQHGCFDFPSEAAGKVIEFDYHAESRAGLVVEIRKEGGVSNGLFVLSSHGLMKNASEFGRCCDPVALLCETYKLHESAFDPRIVEYFTLKGVHPAPLVSGVRVGAQG